MPANALAPLGVQPRLPLAAASGVLEQFHSAVGPRMPEEHVGDQLFEARILFHLAPRPVGDLVALEQPRAFECAFMVRSSNIGRLPEELARHNWSTFQLAVEQVAECMAHGIFRQDDPVETSILLWAEAHGLITLYKMHRFGGDAEVFKGIYRRSIERLFEALKP